MPEVSETPPVHELFTGEQSTDIKIPEFSEQQLKEMPLGDLQGVLRGSLYRQNQEAKDDPELQAAIKNVRNLVFGPLFYGPEVIGRTEDLANQETSARLQHFLTHSILFASTAQASEQFTDATYSMVSMMEILSRRRETEFSYLRNWWKGTKVELATAKALKDNSFRVRFPNYTDPSPEVRVLDIKSGIDLMAFPENDPRTIITVATSSGGGERRRSFAWAKTLGPNVTEDQYWKENVVRFLRGKNNRRVIISHVEVFAPGDGDRTFTPLYDFLSHKEALAVFGSLHQEVQNAIIGPIKKEVRQKK